MSPTSRHGNGAGGNGAGGFDDFDDFIRDREDEFSSSWDDPADPYADFGQPRGSAQPGIDRGLVEAIARIIDGLAGIAGDALSPEMRKQMERALRDLLVVLRDIINAMIERIDNRREDDYRVEEIPID